MFNSSGNFMQHHFSNSGNEVGHLLQLMFADALNQDI